MLYVVETYHVRCVTPYGTYDVFANIIMHMYTLISSLTGVQDFGLRT